MLTNFRIIENNFISFIYFFHRVLGTKFELAVATKENFFKNKICHQNKFIIIFKTSTPFEFGIKMTKKFTSELEIGERFTTAISGISVKKVTKLRNSIFQVSIFNTPLHAWLHAKSIHIVCIVTRTKNLGWNQVK